MKKNINRSILTIIVYLALFGSILHAQQRNSNSAKKTNSDNLLRVIDNTIYRTYYNTDYWKKSIVPVFSILKAEIGKTGELKSLNFSDSADSLFTKELLGNPTHLKTLQAALQEYARNATYKNISILIPVSYQPNYSPTRDMDYKHVEALLQFNKKDLVGKTIIFSPVRIKVLSKGNS